jgi:hypothetical protein
MFGQMRHCHEYMLSSSVKVPSLESGAWYRVFQNLGENKGNYKKMFRLADGQISVYQTIVNQIPTVFPVCALRMYWVGQLGPSINDG